MPTDSIRTTWLVQSNVSPESPTPHQLRQACDAEGLALVAFAHPPGVRRAPDIPVAHADGPIVFHARSAALLGALDSRWSSGVFFSPERFCHAAYAAHYGDEYLNSKAALVSWDELLRRTAESNARDEHLFIKPADDYKGFTGHVLSTRALAEAFRQLSLQDPRIGLATEVVVSPATEVDAEWRCFIVDGEVVAASMYRPVGSADVPPSVLAYARDMARGWAPAPVHVLDIGRAEGRLRVIECNCFNASRFYYADVRRIVGAVSAFQEERYRVK